MLFLKKETSYELNETIFLFGGGQSQWLALRLSMSTKPILAM